MSQSTTLILLPQTSFTGINSTITGVKFPAASYYLSKQNLQTINWNVSTFTGTARVQATLAEDPTTDDWFTVLNIVGNNTTQISFSNIPGNFVWIRVLLTSFSTGTINYIKVSY
jgi:hypothetical protein